MLTALINCDATKTWTYDGVEFDNDDGAVLSYTIQYYSENPASEDEGICAALSRMVDPALFMACDRAPMMDPTKARIYLHVPSRTTPPR